MSLVHSLLILFVVSFYLYLKGYPLLGRPTIQASRFYLAKSSIAVIYLLLVLNMVGYFNGEFQSGGILLLTGSAVFAIGSLLISLATINLGKSLSIGLTSRKRKLKTSGLYSLSRNPIYLGVFLSASAVVLITGSITAFIVTAVLVTLHHQIIKSEEQFLADYYRQEWTDYSAKVRRYI